MSITVKELRKHGKILHNLLLRHSAAGTRHPEKCCRRIVSPAYKQHARISVNLAPWTHDTGARSGGRVEIPPA